MTTQSTGGPASVAPRKYRIRLSAVSLTMIVTALLVLFYNQTFWARGAEIFAHQQVKLGLFIVVIYCLTLAVFAPFSLRHIVRPFLALMLIITAVTSYYMDTLGAMINREMIQNVVTTTFTESKHLFTLGFALHVLFYGVLPAAALLLVQVKKQRLLWTMAAPALMLVISVTLALGLLMANYKAYSLVLRERKDFLGSYQPGAPIVGAIRYARMMAGTTTLPLQAIGEDARKGDAYAEGRQPVLTLVIAGETARAMNFSLNGYDRPTNPELAQRDIVNFSNVSSCGTATAVSLPCMFSKYSRADFTFERGVSTESLADVLHHAGFNVEWWDNNTGSKGVADRVPGKVFTNTENPVICPTGECMDEIFVENLKAFVPTIKQDTVLFLHQIGSHGPTYYLRYPEEFEAFKPACRTAELTECTPEEITNVYDNTILYTDHILAEMIDLLSAQQGLATSLIYVSDHGESLGEGGLYLHGTPYFMAPEVQTSVPMILWMSDTFETRFGIGKGCVQGKAHDSLSHDNLFHSVLGLLDVVTTEHDPALDIFADCRSDRQAARQ